MTRVLTGHQVNPANDLLKIEVLDEPGAGGAHHAYSIDGFSSEGNPSAQCFGPGYFVGLSVLFQNGPIGEAGVNGVTHEALLAILIDRLECFQAGPYMNHFNGIALDFLRAAKLALLDRTRERMARGVEGTNRA